MRKNWIDNLRRFTVLLVMPLFLLAGISAWYSQEKRSAKVFRKSRTLKLLAPSQPQYSP